MRENFYGTKTVHSPSYYKSLLLALIAGVTQGLNYSQVAEKLNALNILTPTGLSWVADGVKQAHKKLIHSARYPSKLHYALLQLVYDGEMTIDETRCLLKPRRM